MNKKFHRLHLVLFFLFFSITVCIGLAKETDFNSWISWNVNNYNKKYVDLGKTESISEKSSRVIDSMLQMAEISKTEIFVSQDDNGDFRTINEAINSIPLKNTRRVILHINSGIYREKVNIPKTMRFITFIGNGNEPPVITGNYTASSMSGRDVKTPRTFRSATVAVDADYFVAVNVIFENTAPHVVGSVGGQAVALRISGTKAAFYNCSFYGIQDTLYDHKGLHYFSNCLIQGSVDFIFGYGTSLYENCYLNSVTKKVASLTAQKGLNASMSSGFSFKNCNITGTGSIYLGRAWGDYSRVIFSYTFMDKIVRPQGWSDWGKRTRDQTVYYGEYKCSGPGANLTGRVPWARLLTDEEAIPFIGTHYINGDTWLL